MQRGAARTDPPSRIGDHQGLGLRRQGTVRTQAFEALPVQPGLDLMGAGQDHQIPARHPVPGARGELSQPPTPRQQVQPPVERCVIHPRNLHSRDARARPTQTRTIGDQSAVTAPFPARKPAPVRPGRPGGDAVPTLRPELPMCHMLASRPACRRNGVGRGWQIIACPPRRFAPPGHLHHMAGAHGRDTDLPR